MKNESKQTKNHQKNIPHQEHNWKRRGSKVNSCKKEMFFGTVPFLSLFGLWFFVILANCNI